MSCTPSYCLKGFLCGVESLIRITSCVEMFAGEFPLQFHPTKMLQSSLIYYGSLNISTNYCTKCKYSNYVLMMLNCKDTKWICDQSIYKGSSVLFNMGGSALIM